MLAPEPQLSACLRVLYLATIEARVIGWHKGDYDKLAALMDAVHNIPLLMKEWERCDESLLLAMLKDYDETWGGALRDEYERVIVGR